ncbi:MAG: macro domain-containing protein [Propionibacteriaceae bacterium]|nr:macro domain-containing protein [Propionibacteriaceae bacterium]
MASTATPQLVLVDLDEDLTTAWRTEFDEWADDVEIHTARIDSVLAEVDAVVSAGNSYGEMNGGVDLAITRALPQAQHRVWQHLGEQHFGYQPVGTAAIVPTGETSCRWLIYAPTMRVPMPLTNGRDIAIHDALWATLVAITRHNRRVAVEDRISSLACPGFGTGYGKVPPARAAALMSAAYRCWRAGPASPRTRETLLTG